MPPAKSVEWETPQVLFDSLNEEFGFTLDPAASVINAKCDKYYTIEDNGLEKSWSDERVFLNPPYGKGLDKWIRKCYEEVYSNGCQIVVALLPNRTDTKWFHDYILGKAEIRFVRGRLKFSNKGTATFGSLIVIWEKDREPNIYSCDREGNILR